MARLCRVLRISRKTGYNWLSKYKTSGLEELLKNDLGGRPKKAIPVQVQKAILEFRSEFGWNEKQIQFTLNKEMKVSFYTVRQILAQANVLGVAPKRKKYAYKDFQRPLPNHLWQGDFSLLEEGNYLFALIDDHSRYLVDAQVCSEITTESALSVVERAVQRHGTPFQLMTDHGVQFYNNRSKKPNLFGDTLANWNIEHILAGVKHPQTNGKIERWFRTFKDAENRFPELESYLYYYNFCRPHAGIKYAKPYEKYFAYKI